MKTIRVLVLMGLFISMEVILTRFFSIQTDILRIGFGFLPVALSAMVLGPVRGGIVAMFADIIGMLLFPKGVYFPGFTFSALCSGLTYGIILYQKPKTILRISIAVLIVVLFVDLGLNTYWLSIITGKAAYVLLIPRMIKSWAMLPVQIFLISIMWKSVSSYVRQYFPSAE